MAEKYLPKRCDKCSNLILINIKDLDPHRVYLCSNCCGSNQSLSNEKLFIQGEDITTDYSEN